MSTLVAARLSHPLLRFILAIVLSLTVALPTTALAAPVRQPTDTAEAVLLAYYESDAIVGADGSEVSLGLYLYEDETFELEVYFGEEEEPSVAYGDYVETDDGVTLTLLGADGEDFTEAEVVDLELLWDADDTLLLPADTEGLELEEDIILYPTELSADDSGTSTEEDTDEDTTGDEDFSVAIGGVYVSPVQPSEEADSAGIVYMFNLLEDGSASLSSDYLNLAPPIFELGTWTDNGDGSVTVDITGTVDEDYEESIVIEATVGEYGELIVGEIYLYPLEILSYLQDDGSGEEIGSEESEVYVYVAEVTFPGDSEATSVYLLLNDDGSVILTDEGETATLYGEWTFEEDVLYVSITSDDEEEFEEAVEFEFEFNDEDALVATVYPTDIFGEDELIFYASDDGEGAGASAGEGEGTFYFYESDPVTLGDADGVVLSLILSEDGSAIISSDYGDGEEPYLEYGEWTSDADGIIVLSITEGPEGVYDEPFVFTFEEDPDDYTLYLVEESVEIFGEDGLIFYRINE